MDELGLLVEGALGVLEGALGLLVGALGLLVGALGLLAGATGSDGEDGTLGLGAGASAPIPSSALTLSGIPCTNETNSKRRKQEYGLMTVPKHYYKSTTQSPE